MNDIDELLTAPDASFAALRAGILSALHCALPGTVRSFDPALQTVSVLPALRLRDAAGNPVEPPLLEDVPVFFPGGAAGALTYPVSPGDGCLVIFSDACADDWFDPSAPRIPRRHSLSDGFALVGFRPRDAALRSFPPEPDFFGRIPEIPPYATSAKTAAASNSAGTADTVSRGDHVHALPFATSARITGDANAAGSANAVSRGDHVHAAPDRVGFTVTRKTDASSSGTLTGARSGNVCVISGTLNVNAVTSNAWVTVAAVPSGVRPPNAAYFAAASASREAIAGRLDTSGNLQLYLRSSSAAGNHYFNLTYIRSAP